MKALPRVFLATFLAALLSGLVASVGGATGTPAQVVGLRIDGVINAYTADYITANISGAEQQGSAAVLITMDTPGGIDGPMRRIIQSILQTPLPVVIYVSPSGARAASAGLYISQAADVLAMAPGTNIGSAHPVSLSTSGGTGSSGSSVEDTKVLNDAAAYIRGLSALHGRNADWAEQAVRQSVNITAADAVSRHVADLVSDSTPSLLRAIDGRMMQKNHQPITLHLAGAQIETQEMSFFQRLLHDISDPSLASLLLLLALVAIGFEVTHPGAVWPGIVGVMAGVLALVALDTVPVSFGGLALFALAAVLFAIDLKAPSHGVLTTGGVISLIVGSLLVSDAASPFFVPNLALVAIPPLVAGALVAFVLSKTMAARRRPVQTGPDRLVGSLGQTRSEVGPGGGMVFVDGALWQARPVRAARIKPGSSVRVVAVEGIRLTVEPVG